MRASPFGFTNFSRGLNVIDSPYTLQDGEARDVLNMVSSPRGAIKKRPGSTIFASSASASFPTGLVVKDTFAREENPLSNGGKWTALQGHAASTKGGLIENHWSMIEMVTEEPWGAFWNVAEQLNPAVSVEVQRAKGPAKMLNLGDWVAVLASIDATAKKWYEVRATCTNKATQEVTLSIIKENSGVATTLASAVLGVLKETDKIGITVRNNVVTAWRFTVASGTWFPIVSVEDSSFNQGFTGIRGEPVLVEGSHGLVPNVVLNNFAFGEISAPSTDKEFTSILPCKIGATNYLIAVSGKKILSVTETGEINDITDGLAVTEGVPWSIIQSTSGAPNRVVADGPIYLSNGTDPPRYWTGVTKTTAVAEWTGKPEGTFAAVPKAKYLTYLGNRIWASGISTDPTALRFSGFAVKAEEGEQADPTNWPKENVVWFEKDSGEPITGTGIAGPYLMVFKPHATWAVFDLNEGENRRISDSVGCISFRSIVETPQGTFFLTPDQGVFITNGTGVREVSRNVRPILQGTDSNTARAAKQDKLESAAAEFLNGHYYLTYIAQDGSVKTLDYDSVLQSWWLHDLGGNQWVHWEPTAGNSSLYTVPKKEKAGIVKAFVPGVYQDSGVNYTGAKGLTCYWASPWEPFFQYIMRHRLNQPQVRKRIRTLFVDGKGELITQVARKFEGAFETLKGTVDNADMAEPKSSVTLGNVTAENQAVRYYSLGLSRVWSFQFGNATSEPLEIDAYACDLTFKKS